MLHVTLTLRYNMTLQVFLTKERKWVSLSLLQITSNIKRKFTHHNMGSQAFYRREAENLLVFAIHNIDNQAFCL
jgi:hypothetical protein